MLVYVVSDKRIRTIAISLKDWTADGTTFHVPDLPGHDDGPQPELGNISVADLKEPPADELLSTIICHVYFKKPRKGFSSKQLWRTKKFLRRPHFWLGRVSLRCGLNRGLASWTASWMSMRPSFSREGLLISIQALRSGYAAAPGASGFR